MDVVYFIDSRTRDFRPLKLSIKSLRKNFINLEEVYVIGKKPKDIAAIEIPFEDIGITRDRGNNITNKQKMIINDDRISNDFLMMHDDIYFMKEMSDVPYYHLGTLKEFNENTDRSDFISPFWKRRIEAMTKMFPGGKFYEAHCPIVMNKKILREVLKTIPRLATRRTYYCNFAKVKGVKAKDFKIYKEVGIKNWKLPFLSTTNRTETDNISDQIEQML